MSRTAITSKFKMRWLQTKDVTELESCKQLHLVSLMLDEDKTFSGSLGLDLKIRWRHVDTHYISVIVCANLTSNAVIFKRLAIISSSNTFLQ